MKISKVHYWVVRLVMALALVNYLAQARSYFVAPNGADTQPGTLEQPFATFARAQMAAREVKGREPVVVYLRQGIYYLPKTLTFTPEDSGRRAARVTYKSYEKEQVVLSGGIQLKNLKWEPYKNGIMKTSVEAGFTTDQLFINGQRQQMARYPKFNPLEPHFNGYAADAISPARAARWKDPRGGFIHALHASEWGGMHYLITGKGPDNEIQYEGGWQNNRPAGMHKDYRMVENIFEELDAPGEWFLDSASSTLYFYPPSDLNLSTATVEAVRLRHLIEFRGSAQNPVRYVNLEGLTFRHTTRTFMENREPLVRSDWTTYRGGAIFYTGTENCELKDSSIDQVGGNAVFVNNYNRGLVVRGCLIANAGANGVAFVGNRDAARVPRDWKDRSQNFSNVDRQPGPKNDDYPADCLVDDCLIYRSGRVEKQTAPVQIELAQDITVRHCSLYDVPRAGINIGDGCWGGHIIEFCDIFDTVKETGDHGSFNSWGRDRWWGLEGLNLNDDSTWKAEKDLVRLDALKTVTLNNNRWRCDHGWDIDLDDGSTGYVIRNNLCLNGGIKNREGFYRLVENNIMVNNGFHPHVWFKHSQDVVQRNIMWTDHYLPAGGMPSTPWGREMDFNLVHRAGVNEPVPATKLSEQSKRDAHSIIADALFIDPAHGDFRVKKGSPALALGFKNFPMDQFGVQKPGLKAIARTPQIPATRGQVSVQFMENYDPAGGKIPLYDDPQTDWKRFRLEETSINGVRVRIITPEKPAAGNPWLLERSLADPAQVARLLLEKGFYYVCMDVDDFGSPQTLERWDALYAELTGKRGLSKKVVLQGYSRSGLGVYNWAAANPEKVACIYLDAPVLNIQSWPGGKLKGPGWPDGWASLQKLYGFKSESDAIAYTNNPVDKAETLAKANVPIIHVCGEKDLTVPYDENTGLFKERYEKAGGHNMTIIIKGGTGHWTHGLKDPTPIVDFILKAVGLSQ